MRKWNAKERKIWRRRTWVIITFILNLFKKNWVEALENLFVVITSLQIAASRIFYLSLTENANSERGSETFFSSIVWGALTWVVVWRILLRWVNTWGYDNCAGFLTAFVKKRFFKVHDLNILEMQKILSSLCPRCAFATSVTWEFLYYNPRTILMQKIKWFV